jgi:hypothetical protein
VIRMLAAGLIVSAAACARNGASSSPDKKPSESVAAAPVISLERTPCFGSCPVYRVEVSASGEVRYEGKAHVRKAGVATGNVTKEQVRRLLSDLESAGYFAFPERYTAGEPACGRYVTDSPTVITSATVGGRTKTVTHDYGCSGAPGALTVLERRIDDVLSSGQWTGR